MDCQICHENEATMKITRISDGAAEEFNVCADCASQVSPYHEKIAKKNKGNAISVQNLLKQLLEGAEGVRVEQITDIPVCSDCGLNYLQFRKSSMLGCAHCYDAFGDRLMNDIRRIHGATHHVEGTVSSVRPVDTIDAQLVSLRRQLEDAISREDFESAARLRDEAAALRATAGTGKNEAAG